MQRPLALVRGIASASWLHATGSPLAALLELQPSSLGVLGAHVVAQRWLTTQASGVQQPGLFGIAGLVAPAHFQVMVRTAKDRCNDILAQVLAAPADARVVQLMDDMSDELCRTYDAAEACRNVHQELEWRAAATKACVELGAYIGEVNQHEGMYRKLASALDAYSATVQALAAPPPGGGSTGSTTPPAVPLLSNTQLAEWCSETVLVGSKLRMDMEQAGIALPQPQRERMHALMDANNHFGAAFNAALADPQQLGSVSPQPKGQQQQGALAGLLRGMRRKHLQSTSAQHTSPSSSWGGRALPLDPNSVFSFLTHEEDEGLRQQVFMAASASPASNGPLLDRMLGARRQMAGMLGYPSFSAMRAHSNSLAGNPAAVGEFLRQLADAVRPGVQRDLQELAVLKARLGGVSGGSVRVEAWDMEHLTARAKGSRQAAAQAAGAPALEAASEYLELGSVLRGVSALLQTTFGLRVELAPAGAPEAWAPGVQRMRFSHAQLGDCGTVYLDLEARPGKYPSAVTFPIRCGRALPGGNYQAPIMALLADFGGGDNTGPRLRLGWRDLRVLLHELGHVCHSLLSRTRYQHLWGTRCAQDVVEVPSHLFEHFTSHPASLGLLARHRSSGEPMPHALMEQLQAGRQAFAACELQSQILLAAVDQAYFGEGLIAPGGGTGEVWAQVAATHSALPHVPGSRPELRLGHLAIYGGTYYAYLYARCLAAQAWAASGLAADPLDPAAGDVVRTSLLQPGGSIEPLDLIKGALSGRGSSSSAGLQQLAGGWAPCPALYLQSAGVLV